MSDDTARQSTAALARFLRNFSAEVTSGDRKSLEAAARLLKPASEVFIASLPSDPPDRQIVAASLLSRAGLTPVPHIAARNIKSLHDLDLLLMRLTTEAGVDRALILAGDRDVPAGELISSLQLLQTGLFQRHGIRKIVLSWYPEGHPRISPVALVQARTDKLAAAADAGLDVMLLSQFCFEAAPIIASAKQIRAEGIQVPLRVGVAGPASRAALLKYAMICGIGASIRALKERPAARGMLSADTPAELLNEVARAQAADPSLGFEGVHFFTFASLAATAKFADEHSRAGEAA